MNTKRILSLVLALTMVLAMAACGASAPSPNAQPAQQGGAAAPAAPEAVTTVEASSSSKDTLVIANTDGEPGNLHPYNQVSKGAVIEQVMIFNALITIDPHGVIQPSLAESWEVTDDSLTFHLRKDVKFSNGDPLTVDDVIFSMKELITNSTGGKGTYYSSIDVDNITAPDEYTVVCPMKEKNSGQLSYFQEMFIVNKKAYQEMGDQYQYNPVGTGPFKLDEWVVGDHITLVANENYFEGAPLIKKVIVRTISEVSQALIEVETGGADLMVSPNGADVVRVLNGEIKGVKAVSEATLVLRNNNVNFNHNSQYFSKHEVREALARAIDRDSWVKIISPGVGIPAYCSIASGTPGWDPDAETNYPYTYDLEKAKELLAEAGYPNGFKCTLLTDNRAYHQTLVELLQASLSSIGIELDVQTMELNKQKEIMTTGEGYDLYILDNVGNNGDALSSIWRDSNPNFSGPGGANYLNYTIEKEGAQEYLDKMVEIRECTDEAQRNQLCKEREAMFTEHLIWVPVNSIQSYILTTETLFNVGFFRDMIKITHTTHFA